MVFDTRRVAAAGGADDRLPDVREDDLSTRYPLVVQFLTLEVYGDGTKRVPGSITLFSDVAMLKACLNDKDVSMAAFVSGGGLAGLLDAMERGLGEDRLDWRLARPGKKGRR